MTAGRFLLDTNIVVGLFAGAPEIVAALAEAPEVFLCSTVLGELYYGAHKSQRARDNTARIDELAAASTVLGCDLEVARFYGRLKSSLAKQGKPIPENDLWIAATALRFGLTLVTRDDHFAVIEGLSQATW
jgi:tRNA(fMet)-specific endonuclease VapC